MRTVKVRIAAIVAMLFISVFTIDARTFTVSGGQFLLDGKPFVIRSGEMHYPRVPREYWRERFRYAKSMGLNTITTYVFWNLHEKSPGVFLFTQNLDIAEYARIAKEEGLFLIVRPGPYICTEWDFGGIPSWLLKDADIKVRTSDPRFTAATARYMKEVGKQLAPMQITNGGNVIMVQVENEYGSFGDDKTYLESVRKSIVDAGFTVPLFTSDGSLDYMLKNGTLPDLTSVINFDSSDNPIKEFDNFAKFRTGVPKMVGEYWIGWFDHWGEKHHTVDPKVVSKGVDYMLSNGISFNLYMFHGGTTFGSMAGANYSRKEPYQPDTSSYDYDSPLDEAGRPTAKYFALREVIAKHLQPGETLSPVEEKLPLIEIPTIELKRGRRKAVNPGFVKRSDSPMSMEQINPEQQTGFILYETQLTKDGRGALEVNGANDYAHVYIDGKLIGKLDRRLRETKLEIDSRKGATLRILVESMGRLNFGKEFINDRKGITGTVTFNGEPLKGWKNYYDPYTQVSKRLEELFPTDSFFRGRFRVTRHGDTFLDMRGWGKGHVWINGRHLGRFWGIGPQQTLYVPGVWLTKGVNSIVVLDLENKGHNTIRGLTDPVFETPEK